MKKITEHFNLKEFFYSNTAIRKGIENETLDKDIILNIKNLCVNVLEPLREKYDEIKIISGYRCDKLNKLVGGSKKSQHLIGKAADIIFPKSNLSLKKIFNEISKSDLEFDQLIFEFDSWIHISFNKDNNRKEKLVASKENGKTIYMKK